MIFWNGIQGSRPDMLAARPQYPVLLRYSSGHWKRPGSEQKMSCAHKCTWAPQLVTAPAVQVAAFLNYAWNCPALPSSQHKTSLKLVPAIPPREPTVHITLKLAWGVMALWLSTRKRVVEKNTPHFKQVATNQMAVLKSRVV